MTPELREALHREETEWTRIHADLVARGVLPEGLSSAMAESVRRTREQAGG